MFLILIAILSELQERLSDCVRIAILGRTKSGKSTLVNAILGDALAPTGIGECTLKVMWFRHGRRDEVVAHLDDGTTKNVLLSHDRRFPESEDFGCPIERIVHFEAYLANPQLTSMTLVDTPGFDSATHDHEPISLAAARDADAVIFLIQGQMMADDQKMLNRLCTEDSVSAGLGSAANVLVSEPC